MNYSSKIKKGIYIIFSVYLKVINNEKRFVFESKSDDLMKIYRSILGKYEYFIAKNIDIKKSHICNT